jgi:hypothetical protein
VMMASTAYGGSSQLTDMICEQTGLLKKHTFDVMGTISMERSIQQCLDRCSKLPSDELMPTTVLFVEVPTNPDMKVPDMAVLAKFLSEFATKTNKRVLLLVDTTFAPASNVLGKMQQIAPGLNVVVFLSMSKSVSRGHTVAGALVFNHTTDGLNVVGVCGYLFHFNQKKGRTLYGQVSAMTAVLDTSARPDQLRVLCDNHVGVEERCAKAYHVAEVVGKHFVESVRQITGHEMRLAFVSPATAAAGFTTSTFSFNLPAIAGASETVNEGLAQRFVDLIVGERKDLFKPCVSFGQDNGLVYCTVPATSTQGVCVFFD